MTSAFISYQHKDRPVATYIAAELEQIRGVTVFIDYQKLRGGEYRVRLGKEVVKNDYFVVLVSPRSVESQEVRFEYNLALDEKPNSCIIPFLIEEIDSWAKVYPLLSLERVQLQFNSSEDPLTSRSMRRAIKRLEELMGVQDLPRDSEPRNAAELTIAEEAKSEIDSNGDQSSEQPTPPEFSDEDIDSLFESALAIQAKDPERAMFLYQLVLDIDPDYLQGRIHEFVERQRENMKPARLKKLKERIRSAKKKGNWTEVIQLAKTMIDIDPDSEYAAEQIYIAEKNSECEPIYEQAKVLRENGNEEALSVLMADIQSACPDHGDPARLLANQPIRQAFVKYVRNRYTLEEYNGAVRKLAFSNSGSMLATASSDASTKVWSVSTGDLIFDINCRASDVRALEFSPDDRYIALGSRNGHVELIDVEQQTLIASESIGPALNDIEFAAEGKILITCGGPSTLLVHKVPDIKQNEHVTLPMFDESANSAVAHDRTAYSSIRGKDNHGWYSLILRWNIRQGHLTSSLSFTSKVYGASRIDKLSLSYDGKHLASVGQQSAIWETTHGDLVCNYRKRGAGYNVKDLAFSPIDSSLIVLAGGSNGENCLHYFDLAAEKLLCSQNVHDGVVNAVAMSPDGRFIATASDDWTAKIWQL